MKTKTAAAMALIVLSGLRAQTFNSGSTGVDGALNLTTPGVILFDPAARGVDTDGDGIFHFTTINIAAGVTVRLRNTQFRGRPAIWLASGAVQITGTIDLNGEEGHLVGVPPASRVFSEAGAGGYSGGASAYYGLGPGRWAAYCGGAGHATPGSGGAGSVYGNVALVPLRGGSGGSGCSTGAGGGAGGGAIRLASSVSITVAGTITARGGAGANDASGINPIGGGGSGGAIHLVAPAILGAGALDVAGGGTRDSRSGGPGRIRLDAFQQQFTGTSDPYPSVTTLGSPFLPQPQVFPTVRVVSIAGVAVPPNPQGSFVAPDVAFTQNGPVPVVLEARNVPLGTTVGIYLLSETAADQAINSAPLAGTLALSSATANVTFPVGYSHGYVLAVW